MNPKDVTEGILFSFQEITSFWNIFSNLPMQGEYIFFLVWRGSWTSAMLASGVSKYIANGS